MTAPHSSPTDPCTAQALEIRPIRPPTSYLLTRNYVSLTSPIRKKNSGELTEGRAPAGVMFIQIMAQRVPATPNAHHHVAPEDLRGQR